MRQRGGRDERAKRRERSKFKLPIRLKARSAQFQRALRNRHGVSRSRRWCDARDSDRGRRLANVPDGGDAAGNGRRGRDGGEANRARGRAHRLQLNHLTGAGLRGGARGERGLRRERAGGEPGEHHGGHLERRCAVRYASGGVRRVVGVPAPSRSLLAETTGDENPDEYTDRTISTTPGAGKRRVPCRCPRLTRIPQPSGASEASDSAPYALQSHNF